MFQNIFKIDRFYIFSFTTKFDFFKSAIDSTLQTIFLNFFEYFRFFKIRALLYQTTYGEQLHPKYRMWSEFGVFQKKDDFQKITSTST